MDRQQTLQRLRERIYSFAASRMGRDAADDLAQEVLMVLHEKYGHLDRIEDLLPLSLQIARFKMMAERRKHVRHGDYTSVPVEEVSLPDLHPSQDQAIEFRQRRELLARSMAQLGDRCRQMLAWKLAGKGFAEIQKLLKADSINTVYTWDYRCRKQLIELMGGSWEGPGPAKDKPQ